MTPAWILDIFAALMLVVAAVSAARLVVARPWQGGWAFTDTDVAHLLMAIAMAGMLASSLTTLPSAAWEVIFGLMTAWFAVRVVIDARVNGVRALAGGHCAPHTVHSAAMLFMFLAVAAPAAGGGSGMSGMGGSSASGMGMGTLQYPTLSFIFALILIGYSIWDLDQLSGRRYSLSAARVPSVGAALAGVPAMAAAEPAATTSSGLQATLIAVDAGTTSPAGGAPEGQPVPGGLGAGGSSAAGGVLLSPATTIACRIVMGVTMALMLLLMI